MAAQSRAINSLSSTPESGSFRSGICSVGMEAETSEVAAVSFSGMMGFDVLLSTSIGAVCCSSSSSSSLWVSDSETTTSSRSDSSGSFPNAFEANRVPKVNKNLQKKLGS